jgi:hypothetical protein
MWTEAVVAQSKPFLGVFVMGLWKTTKDITEDIRPEREKQEC